jgi:hypothetical protein
MRTQIRWIRARYNGFRSLVYLFPVCLMLLHCYAAGFGICSAAQFSVGRAERVRVSLCPEDSVRVRRSPAIFREGLRSVRVSPDQAEDVRSRALLSFICEKLANPPSSAAGRFSTVPNNALLTHRSCWQQYSVASILLPRESQGNRFPCTCMNRQMTLDVLYSPELL